MLTLVVQQASGARHPRIGARPETGVLLLCVALQYRATPIQDNLPRTPSHRSPDFDPIIAHV